MIDKSRESETVTAEDLAREVSDLAAQEPTPANTNEILRFILKHRPQMRE